MRRLALLMAIAAQTPSSQVAGVCRIDDQGIACWSLDGHRNAGLTARVQGLVDATPGATFSFVPGRKNRFLIVEGAPPTFESYSEGRNRIQRFSLGAKDPLTIYRVAADPEATTSTVVVQAGRLHGEAAEFRLKEGAKTVVDGVALEVGRGEVDPSWPIRGYRGIAGILPFYWGRWGFPVEQRGSDTPSRFLFDALGSNGRPIRFVDLEGKPVDPKIGEAAVRAAGPFESTSTVFYATFGSGMGRLEGEPLFWLGSNIDPRWIAKVRVRRIAIRTESYGPFPLDPSGP